MVANSIEIQPDQIEGFNGRFIVKERRKQRAGSYQITSIFRRFSVTENVALAVQARSGSSLSFWQPVSSEKALFDEARQILDDVGLAARADQLAGALAHGEQRQLEVGLALATRPRMLLLDEPMAGMGHEDVGMVAEIIRNVARDRAVLMVEHNLSVVSDLCDQITVLQRGEVIAEGDYATVSSDARVREAYMGTDHA